MNEVIAKRAGVFALILGAFIGLISLIPAFIGFCLITLSFFTPIIVILYMKKNEKHLGIIDNQQGAILGGIIGFFSAIGFFITFSPMVCIIHLIFKTYYSYAIPDMVHDAFWLLIVLIFTVALMFAVTNSATGMGLIYVINKIEKNQEKYDKAIDIEIND